MSLGGASSGSETELKFELPPETLERLREHPALAEIADAKRQRSVYFDTPTHELRNGGLSLRVREKEGRFVQTVKTRLGAGLFDRREWEAPIAGGSPDPVEFAKTPVGGVLNGGANRLSPVFAAVVDRRVGFWREGEDLVELSLDQGEIKAGDQAEPICELELELKAGRPQALFRLAHALAEAAPIRLTFDSKAERGYRLAGHEGLAAVKAERATITPDLTAAEAFRRIARGCLGQVSSNCQLLRRARTPEALHQARVGLRRFRAACAAFKPMLAGEGLERIKTETKWLGGEMNAARDVDVFLKDVFSPAAEADEENIPLAALGRRLLRAQAEAYERALEAIGSARFATLLLDAAEWVEVGDWTISGEPAASQPVADFGAGALSRFRAAVRKHGGDLAEMRPELRHALRIRVKKLRYATEFFADIYGEATLKRRRKFVGALKALQEALGQLNDIAVAREKALEMVGPQAAELAFTAGMLVARRAQNEPAQLAAATKAFESFHAAKRFWPQPS
jgi:triphosphatase